MCECVCVCVGVCYECLCVGASEECTRSRESESGCQHRQQGRHTADGEAITPIYTKQNEQHTSHGYAFQLVLVFVWFARGVDRTEAHSASRAGPHA